MMIQEVVRSWLFLPFVAGKQVNGSGLVFSLPPALFPAVGPCLGHMAARMKWASTSYNIGVTDGENLQHTQCCCHSHPYTLGGEQKQLCICYPLKIAIYLFFLMQSFHYSNAEGESTLFTLGIQWSGPIYSTEKNYRTHWIVKYSIRRLLLKLLPHPPSKTTTFESVKTKLFYGRKSIFLTFCSFAHHCFLTFLNQFPSHSWTVTDNWSCSKRTQVKENNLQL